MELHLKTNRENPVPDSINQPEFPCIPILLQMLMAEYDQEKSRTERIDSKLMGLLTIIVALITVYVPIFPFSDFAQVYSKWKTCAIIPFIFSLLILSGIAAIIIAIRSVYTLVGAYKTKDYRSVDIVNFNTNKKLGEPTTDSFQLELIDHYQNIILENSKINANKAKTLDQQFQNIMVIFILLSISSIGALICTGL